MPTVSCDVMSIALQHFAERRALEKNHTLAVLLIDQAGFHSLTKLAIPKNIVLFPLPPYTPELQPTECVWPLLREAVANQDFESLDTLEATLIERCQWLSANTETVYGAVGFDWISYALKEYESC